LKTNSWLTEKFRKPLPEILNYEFF